MFFGMLTVFLLFWFIYVIVRNHRINQLPYYTFHIHFTVDGNEEMLVREVRAKTSDEAIKKIQQKLPNSLINISSIVLEIEESK